MHGSPLLDGPHQLDSIPEGFDEENWSPDTDFGQVNTRDTSIEHVFPHPEGGEENINEFRTRLRRETAETLISNLHSIKPPSATDSRLIEVGILNEV